MCIFLTAGLVTCIIASSTVNAEQTCSANDVECIGTAAGSLLQSQTTRSRRTSGLSLAALSYGGSASRAHEGGTYKYTFSSGFQDQICDRCEDTNCWGAQGISKLGDYLTRSFYEKGSGDECNNDQATYFMITVMRRGSNPTYSNILVENGMEYGNDGREKFDNGKTKRECHAGDHVIRKDAAGVHWFFVACTKYVTIFSENDITAKTETVQGKTFSYFVPGDAVTILSEPDVTFSWISRNDGAANEFYSGSYDADHSTKSALNLKRIQISQNSDGWDLTVLQHFEVASSVAKKVQGATRIGSHMYLATSSQIRRCTMSGGVINSCYRQCKIPEAEEAPDSWDPWSCNKKLVLQGAETDSNGDFYVGTEFDCDNKPFFEINDMGSSKHSDNDEDCYD